MCYCLFLQDDDDNDNDVDDNNDANLTMEISDNPKFIISSEEDPYNDNKDTDDGNETEIYVDYNEQVSIFKKKNTQTLSHIPAHYQT